MGNLMVCRLARCLALMAALAATALVFMASTTGVGTLLDSRTITAATTGS